jgi:LysM repeat protein
MTLDQWFAKYSHGRTLINRGGTQCVAVANAFEAEFVQGAGDEWIGTPLTGWADDWWKNFGRDVDYNEYIKVSAAEKAQKGDVAIWHKYKNNGLPHIAVVYEDNGGLICLTQNPGNAHMESLSKIGLAGYLRPKKLIQSAAVNKKSDDVIAREVLAGAWGNNPERKKRLEAAGYDYAVIQGKVNSLATTPATQAPVPAPTPAPAVPAGYVVKQGDTLGDIITRQGWTTSAGLWGSNGDVARIAAANGISDPSVIHPGKVINKA